MDGVDGNVKEFGDAGRFHQLSGGGGNASRRFLMVTKEKCLWLIRTSLFLSLLHRVLFRCF